jgi:adenosylcobinamide kinase / adenosylcobinamide-phosphate guanylyltransferase
VPRHLITGGARSGKSIFAENLAKASSLPTTYIATAIAGDSEMRERIALHRARRPAGWRTVECGTWLVEALEGEAAAGKCVIVDCLTLWLAGLLTGGDGAEDEEASPTAAQLLALEKERARLIRCLAGASGLVLVVTNELGSGIAPLGRLSRVFVDEHGLTNQRVAEACDAVTLMVSGQPLPLKREPPDAAA